jgi:uncharacterized glyoxalase superfamily protein PhnB
MEKFDHLFVQPRDYTQSFHFYTEILGFKVASHDGSESEADRLAFLEHNGFRMVLAEDHENVNPAEKPPVYQTKGRISLHFHCDDVDAVFNKMPEGPHVVIKPENTHWGTRWFMVEDPDGNQFAWQGPPK